MRKITHLNTAEKKPIELRRVILATCLALAAVFLVINEIYHYVTPVQALWPLIAVSFAGAMAHHIIRRRTKRLLEIGKRGGCPDCGCDRSTLSAGAPCPECGGGRGELRIRVIDASGFRLRV